MYTYLQTQIVGLRRSNVRKTFAKFNV